jgi:nucleotide-binding universal stress UspA family protein
MNTFERPLVAVSLTEQDQSLLEYVRLLAGRLAWSDVDFVHVARENHAQSLERLREVARHCCARETIDDSALHVLEGPLLDQLLRLSTGRQRDLILLGHRRARSGHRAMARRLAMVAPASVWLVPEGASPEITHILAPIDFSDHSADALSVAIAIARANGLDRLSALHVYVDPSTIRYDEHIEEVIGEEEAAFEKLLARVDSKGIEVEPIFVEGGRITEEILRTAQQQRCDLIVMNTRGRSRAASVLLGSTTSDTMADTMVPMLAVKHFGSRMSLIEALTNHRIWDQPSPKMN